MFNISNTKKSFPNSSRLSSCESFLCFIVASKLLSISSFLDIWSAWSCWCLLTVDKRFFERTGRLVSSFWFREWGCRWMNKHYNPNVARDYKEVQLKGNLKDICLILRFMTFMSLIAKRYYNKRSIKKILHSHRACVGSVAFTAVPA